MPVSGLNVLGIGVIAPFRWLLPALILLCLSVVGAPATAASLRDVTCTAQGDTLEGVLAAARSKLDCGPLRFSLGARYVRGSVEVSKLDAIPPGRLVLQANPTSFDSLIVRLHFEDGTRRMIDVDTQMTARNWDANGKFYIDIPPSRSALKRIDVVVERPQSPNLLRSLSLANFEEALADSYQHTLFYIFICGLLCIPVIYDLFFFRVLREQFIAWHMVMTVGTVLFLLSNSGLVNLFVIHTTILQRFGLTFLTSTIIMVGASEFSTRVIEPGKNWPQLSLLLPFFNAGAIMVALVVMLDIEALRTRLPGLFALVTLPVLGLVAATIIHALRKKSRAARFLLVAYSGVLATSLHQLLVTWGFALSSDYLLDAMYVSLVILVLGTAAGVVDRFFIIKSERDRARITARKYGLMATSDGLTGLLNRRAFDSHRRLPRGHCLLLADLDFFKAINDDYGHQVGDAVLVRCARVIEGVMAERCRGKVYRLGGEEFAILCDLLDEEDAMGLAEAVRLAVAEEGAPSGDPAWLPPVTISIGVVLGRSQPMVNAMAAADEALYRAKKGGRDRCVIEGAPTPVRA